MRDLADVIERALRKAIPANSQRSMERHVSKVPDGALLLTDWIIDVHAIARAIAAAVEKERPAPGEEVGR